MRRCILGKVASVMEDANGYQIIISQHVWFNLVSDSLPHVPRKNLVVPKTSPAARNVMIDHTTNLSHRRRNLMNHPSINFGRAPDSIPNLLHLCLDTTNRIFPLRIPQCFVLLFPIARRLPSFQLATPLFPYHSGGTE